MEALCPHCGSELKDGFSYCSSCTRLAKDYQACGKCAEPYAEGAEICPHCQSKVATLQEQKVASLELEVRATRAGAYFTSGNFTGLFFPPIIRVSKGRVCVRKWSLLGLRSHEQEIQVSRVASVRYTKGIIWGGLLIETFGGASEDLTEKGLRQEDAKMMAEKLKDCLQD